MAKLQIAVLRGGPSNDYDASIKTGASVLKYLPEKYQAHDIFISKDGTWHRNGAERTPDRALRHIDVAINALHGEYGEDGKVQQLLKSLNIPYTGSDSVAAAVSRNKILSKKVFDANGIKSPYAVYVEKGDDRSAVTDHVFNHFLLPFIVKPVDSGFSRGVSLVKSFNKLNDALDQVFAISDVAIIEEFIRGREVTCGVINNFRGEQLYTLLPVEVRNSLLDSRVESREIIPGVFTSGEKAAIADTARAVHQALGLRHYSHIDMIVTPRRGIYVLEANTHPSLEHQSRLLQSLEAIGSTLSDFLDHLITLVLEF